MTTTVSPTRDEEQIKQLIDEWAKAVSGKDINRVMSFYAPDILVFDLAPPLKYAGIEAYRKNLEDWFASFEGSIAYEIRDLTISSGGGTGYSRSLNRMTGKRTDGEHTDVWVRATVGFRKSEGKWKVTHEHFSLPFYMEPPYKAARDLKP